MQKYPTYFWNKFNLYSREIAFSCLIVFSIIQNVSAQDFQQTQRGGQTKKKKEINLPNYDEKLLHYGFFLGLNYDRVSFKLNDTYFKDSLYNNITPIGQGGFALGFLMNLRLHDQLAFKLVPSVGFYTRSIEYKFSRLDPDKGITSNSSVQSVETAMIETSFLLKYRSLRRKNTRMYLIGGIKPAIRAGGRRGNTQQERLNITRFDLCVEYGAGFELYFPYFKWSPELRFSHGLVNVNGANETFNAPFSALYTHTVSLYFFFE